MTQHTSYSLFREVKLASFSLNALVRMVSNNLFLDYWNGEKVVPIKKDVSNAIQDILFQWQANDFKSVGFSYKPVTPDLQQLI